MKTLPIVWQRLVAQGRTCDRCSATGSQLEAAVATLEAALRPLGLRPELRMQELDEATFRAQPAESNRLWIAGRPLEEWLGAGVGASRCCAVCGDAPCRTLDLDGHRHEAIPAALIVRAGLLAAARAMAAPDARDSDARCCADRT